MRPHRADAGTIHQAWRKRAQPRAGDGEQPRHCRQDRKMPDGAKGRHPDGPFDGRPAGAHPRNRQRYD